MNHRDQFIKVACLCKLAEVDNSKIDFLSGALTYAGNSLGLMGLGNKYLNTLPTAAVKEKGNKKLFKRVKKQIPADWYVESTPASSSVKYKGVNSFLNEPEWAKAKYNLLPKRILAPEKNTAALAHELGHVQGGKGLMIANAIGKRIFGLGSLGTAFSNDRDFANTSANVGTAGALATLASELDASRRGSTILGRAGVKGLGKLKSFVGIPTYLLAALAPQLAFHTKDKLDGYDRIRRPVLGRE